MRLVGEKGEQLGVVPIAQALDLAKKSGVDLVEVAPTAVPPVCRLLDYGKYRYEQTKKERQAKKGQKISELKEMRLRPKIGDHDLEAKMRFIKKFLAEGDKVKITVMFRGREMAHTTHGRAVLDRIVNDLQNDAVIEQPPRMEGRNMTMLLGAKAKEAAAKK